MESPYTILEFNPKSYFSIKKINYNVFKKTFVFPVTIGNCFYFISRKSVQGKSHKYISCGAPVKNSRIPSKVIFVRKTLFWTPRS